MDCQDWTPVVIGNGKQHKVDTKSKQNPSGNKEFHRLNEDDIPKLDKITQTQSRIMREARNAKGLSQNDLAKSLNINVAIIRDYENGTVSKFNLKFYKSVLRKLGVQA